MKRIIVAGIIGFTVLSCNKVEDKINETVQQTKEKVQQEAQKVVEETVSESINSLTNSQDVKFDDVFKNAGTNMISEAKGKTFKFPNGTEGFIFKYKADKAVLIPFLENQLTTDESKSDQKVRRIDGQSIVDKISLVEKFLPENTVDTGFLEDMKNDQSIEYYKLKRFPNSSTIIYNPKNQTVLQYVEVDK
ncbi:MAG: hypothetical protein K0R36_3810 [Chryseobacterium sp.]|jgi:hypothetical protein|nr:hypothetical protein [Chryseobacterium sp.]